MFFGCWLVYVRRSTEEVKVLNILMSLVANELLIETVLIGIVTAEVILTKKNLIVVAVVLRLLLVTLKNK